MTYEFEIGDQVRVVRGVMCEESGMINGMGRTKTRVYFPKRRRDIWFNNVDLVKEKKQPEIQGEKCCNDNEKLEDLTGKRVIILKDNECNHTWGGEIVTITGLGVIFYHATLNGTSICLRRNEFVVEC